MLHDKYHMKSIGLFGSIVRNDFNVKTSDIDILIDFDKPIGVAFIDLAEELEKELNFKVDLISKNGLKKSYYENIKSELIYV